MELLVYWGLSAGIVLVSGAGYCGKANALIMESAGDAECLIIVVCLWQGRPGVF